MDSQVHRVEKGLALSLLLMAVGAVVFGEFSTQRYYAGALAGLFVIGSGLALQQTAVNPYISILGPIESAARRIAVMGICNKVAGILAPLVIGSLVLHGVGDLSMQVATADPATKEQLLCRLCRRDSYTISHHGRFVGSACGGRVVFSAAGVAAC